MTDPKPLWTAETDKAIKRKLHRLSEQQMELIRNLSPRERIQACIETARRYLQSAANYGTRNDIYHQIIKETDA